MSLLPILIIISFSLALSILTPSRWRSWILMVASIIAIYWLQPSMPIRNLDFWLPTLSICLSLLVWVITVPRDNFNLRPNIISGLVIAAVILTIGIPRYLGDICCLTTSRPPAIPQILIVIFAMAILVTIAFRFTSGQKIWIVGFSILIIAVLIVLKFEPLTKLVSMGLRSVNNQSLESASGVDIRWLGFSYIAFRLLHTLYDRASGRLPELSLQDYVIYIIFYPSISAGPIDRVQHFVRNLRQPTETSIDGIISGGKRILFGIFIKFVLADGLAFFALNSTNADQVNSAGWLWVMLYAYALRIYFDFAGYTDIAIGIGNLLGIQLPENFEKPYRKQNITLFWNSWHMTLAGWFRAYFFNPLTRSLRSQPRMLPLPLIIFIGQLSTFLLIGLWHGITWNFAIWGIWHGIGLFIHNRWTQLVKSRGSVIDQRPRIKSLFGGASTLLTFHYVSLGWIWFALISPAQSWHTILRLFGLG